jgi:hypothetical protein
VAVTASDVLPPASSPPSFGSEGFVAIVTVVGVVLLGAPLGLLWAAVAPPVEVVVAAGGATMLADPTNDGFIAVDGFFLGLAVLAGALCGAVAWRVGRRHGLGVVVGLVIGGLLAAEVARLTGELVDEGQARAVVEAGREGVVELSVQLRAESARTGWPVAALAAHMVLTLFSSRHRADELSSG